MSEDRTECRITPRQETGVAISVADGERCVLGHVLDLSSRGAGIAFPASQVPRIDVGGVCTLLVDTSEFDQPLMVPSFIRNRINGRGAVRFGFEFIDNSFQEMLPPQVRRFFNRRGSTRVQLDDSESITVVLEGEDIATTIEAKMCDLSVNGLAFIARVKLLVGSELDVTFLLPGIESPLSFHGILRHRTEVDDGSETVWRCGIAFLPTSDELFDRQQRAIAGFIRAYNPSKPAQV